MNNLKKKAVIALCVFGLFTAPVMAVENRTNSEASVKRIKVETSYAIDYNSNLKSKSVNIEKFLTDGTRIYEEDVDGDGVSDYREIHSNLDRFTTITKYDFEADGIIDTIKTERRMLGGAKIEIDLDADGKTDWVLTEMLTSKGKVTEIDENNDGKIDYRETEKSLYDRVIVKEYDDNADGKIDRIITERMFDKIHITEYDDDADGKVDSKLTKKVLADGSKLTEYISPGESYTLTEKNVDNGFKQRDLDKGIDSVIDYKEFEKTLPDGTKITIVDSNADGKPDCMYIDFITEIVLTE